MVTSGDGSVGGGGGGVGEVRGAGDGGTGGEATGALGDGEGAGVTIGDGEGWVPTGGRSGPPTGTAARCRTGAPGSGEQRRFSGAGDLRGLEARARDGDDRRKDQVSAQRRSFIGAAFFSSKRMASTARLRGIGPAGPTSKPRRRKVAT